MIGFFMKKCDGSVHYNPMRIPTSMGPAAIIVEDDQDEAALFTPAIP
jgi:hypothetical protein